MMVETAEAENGNQSQDYQHENLYKTPEGTGPAQDAGPEGKNGQKDKYIFYIMPKSSFAFHECLPEVNYHKPGILSRGLDELTHLQL